MPLYDPSRQVDVDPKDAVRVVHRFVQRCLDWAEERELPRRTADADADPSPDVLAGLEAWRAYARFSAHTLRELEDGTLDAWFTDDVAHPP